MKITSSSWRSPREFLEKYRDLMEGIASLKFVAGFCYTQLTDIEQETNGLLTYNRKPKLNPQAIAAIHAALFGAGTTDGALQVFTEKFPESKR
jgi:hypothetical protein